MTMPVIKKDTIIGISVGLLIATFSGVAVGAWTLSAAISEFTQRLDKLESSVQYRWSYPMEKDAWNEFEKLNPEIKVPDLKAIRSDNLYQH